MSDAFSHYYDLMQVFSLFAWWKDSYQIMVMRRCNTCAISSCIILFKRKHNHFIFFFLKYICLEGWVKVKAKFSDMLFIHFILFRRGPWRWSPSQCFLVSNCQCQFTSAVYSHIQIKVTSIRTPAHAKFI